MSSIVAAFSTDLEAERAPTIENDYFAQVVGDKHTSLDLSLYSSKWFDYRHMTPLQATGAYMDAYQVVYRRIYGREIDRARSEFVKPLTFEGVLAGVKAGKTKQKRQLVGCWRGRQIADAIGMPYDQYLDLAFTYRMRRWQRAYMPQPEHLYHEWDVEKIVDRWEELKRSRLFTAEHSAYLIQNYQGLPHQDAYHEFLFEQATLRSNAPEFLAQFVMNDQLPASKVHARLDERALRDFEHYLH